SSFAFTASSLSLHVALPIFGQLTGPVPPVSGNQLIPSVGVWAGNRRNQHTILPDAVCGFHHSLVILDFEWMVLKWMQLRQRNFHDPFPLGVGTALLSGE